MKTLKEIHDEMVEGLEDYKEEIIGCFEGTFSVHEGQIRGKLHDYNHQTTLALLENIVEWLEGQKRDTENIKAPEGADIGAYVHCERLRREGYNTALTDTIKYLKEQIDLINNN